MEALFLLLGDLILLPITLFATVLVEGIAAAAAACAAILESGFGITLGLRRRKLPTGLSPEALELLKQKAQRWRKFLQRLAWGLGIVLVLLVTAVCLLNSIFFEPTVRWGLAHLEKRSGVKISFTSAAGSLFSGQLTLKGVVAQRHGNAVSNFDLRADEFALNLSMAKLFARSAEIEKVFISGLKGDFHRVTTPERMKIRKRYEVTHLRLEDAEIAVYDGNGPEAAPFTLKITALDSQPLRSRFAVFDILFRSNASGEIAGRPFLIRTAKTEQGRETTWQAEGLPVAFVGRQLGGPFAWLTGGTVNVRVEDKWKIADHAEIEMRWSFLLQNLVVVTPEGASPTSRLIASAITNYLRRHAEKLDVSFNLTLNENQFEGAASAGAAGLWDATRDGFVRELSRLSGADPERVNQGVKTGIEFMKRHLDNSRKKSP
jgi:hypothetical protein